MSTADELHSQQRGLEQAARQALEGSHFEFVQALAGEDQTARVFVAKDRRTGEQVVLRRLLDEAATDGADLLAYDPGLAMPFDSLEDALGRRYSVSEFIPGVSASVLLHKRGALDWELTRELVSQLASAMAALHDEASSQAVLHPGDCIVELPPSGRPQITLVDLGRAVPAMRAPSERLAYVAPEQLLGKEPTLRTDVYRLGLLTFELVTGRAAFDASDAVAARHQILSGTPPDATDAVGAGVRAWLWRAMAKNPDDRFADMTELRVALPPKADRVMPGTQLPPEPAELAESGNEALASSGAEIIALTEGETTAEAASTPAIVAPESSSAVSDAAPRSEADSADPGSTRDAVERGPSPNAGQTVAAEVAGDNRQSSESAIADESVRDSAPTDAGASESLGSAATEIRRDLEEPARPSPVATATANAPGPSSESTPVSPADVEPSIESKASAEAPAPASESTHEPLEAAASPFESKAAAATPESSIDPILAARNDATTLVESKAANETPTSPAASSEGTVAIERRDPDGLRDDFVVPSTMEELPADSVAEDSSEALADLQPDEPSLLSRETSVESPIDEASPTAPAIDALESPPLDTSSTFDGESAPEHTDDGPRNASPPSANLTAESELPAATSREAPEDQNVETATTNAFNGEAQDGSSEPVADLAVESDSPASDSEDPTRASTTSTASSIADERDHTPASVFAQPSASESSEPDVESSSSSMAILESAADAENATELSAAAGASDLPSVSNVDREPSKTVPEALQPCVGDQPSAHADDAAPRPVDDAPPRLRHVKRGTGEGLDASDDLVDDDIAAALASAELAAPLRENGGSERDEDDSPDRSGSRASSSSNLDDEIDDVLAALDPVPVVEGVLREATEQPAAPSEEVAAHSSDPELGESDRDSELASQTGIPESIVDSDDAEEPTAAANEEASEADSEPEPSATSDRIESENQGVAASQSSAAMADTLHIVPSVDEPEAPEPATTHAAVETLSPESPATEDGTAQPERGHAEIAASESASDIEFSDARDDEQTPGEVPDEATASFELHSRRLSVPESASRAKPSDSNSESDDAAESANDVVDIAQARRRISEDDERRSDSSKHQGPDPALAQTQPASEGIDLEGELENWPPLPRKIPLVDSRPLEAVADSEPLYEDSDVVYDDLSPRKRPPQPPDFDYDLADAPDPGDSTTGPRSRRERTDSGRTFRVQHAQSAGYPPLPLPQVKPRYGTSRLVLIGLATMVAVIGLVFTIADVALGYAAMGSLSLAFSSSTVALYTASAAETFGVSTLILLAAGVMAGLAAPFALQTWKRRRERA